MANPTEIRILSFDVSKFPEAEVLELMESLESSQELSDYRFDFDDGKVGAVKVGGSPAIGFADFMAPGKVMKEFAVSHGLSDADAKKLFSITIASTTSDDKPTGRSVAELDSMIAKVDADDPKLKEVMSRLSALKKKGS